MVTLRLRMTNDGGAAAARRTMCCEINAAVRSKYGRATATVLLPSAGVMTPVRTDDRWVTMRNNR